MQCSSEIARHGGSEEDIPYLSVSRKFTLVMEQAPSMLRTSFEKRGPSHKLRQADAVLHSGLHMTAIVAWEAATLSQKLALAS